MRLPRGRAVRGTYVEVADGAGGRSVRFVAEPSGRFAVLAFDTGAEARCDGSAVWGIDDGLATFTAPVPPGEAFALLPAPMAEMLQPDSDYIDAALSDPGTTDEELVDLGSVRISGYDSSIVYDRSVDMIREYSRPDGLHRRLDDLEVVPIDATGFAWNGPVALEPHGQVIVATTGPVDSVEAALGEPCFTARLEHETEVLAYWYDRPGSVAGGVSIDECVAWAEAIGARATVSVDLLSGENRRLPADRR